MTRKIDTVLIAFLLQVSDSSRMANAAYLEFPTQRGIKISRLRTDDRLVRFQCFSITLYSKVGMLSHLQKLLHYREKIRQAHGHRFGITSRAGIIGFQISSP